MFLLKITKVVALQSRRGLLAHSVLYGNYCRYINSNLKQNKLEVDDGKPVGDCFTRTDAHTCAQSVGRTTRQHNAVKQ